MSKITELASSTINGTDSVTVELVEADETPAAVIIKWPVKATVCLPRRFPDTAAVVVRLFSEAHIALAAIKSRRSV
jgi:hypothetical protein